MVELILSVYLSFYNDSFIGIVLLIVVIDLLRNEKDDKNVQDLPGLLKSVSGGGN